MQKQALRKQSTPDGVSHSQSASHCNYSHRCLSTHASVRRREHHRKCSVSFLFLDLLELLLLEGSWLGEFEGDLVGSELGISVSHAIDLTLNEGLVKWVEEDSLVIAGIRSDSD